MDEVDALQEEIQREIASAQDHLKQVIEERQRKAEKAKKLTQEETPAEKPE